MESSGCMVRSWSVEGMEGIRLGGVAPITRLAEEPIGVSIRAPTCVTFRKTNIHTHCVIQIMRE